MAAEYDTHLQSKGFYCYERCKCSGVFIEKYKPHNENLCIDVKIFPVNKTFLICKNYNQVKIGSLAIFKETLNNIC